MEEGDTATRLQRNRKQLMKRLELDQTSVADGTPEKTKHISKHT